MAKNTLKIATLIAAGAFLGAAPALALDGKLVLDQLVKKGILTPEEAQAILAQDAANKNATADSSAAQSTVPTGNLQLTTEGGSNLNPRPVPVETKNSEVNQINVIVAAQAQAKYTTHRNAGVAPSSGINNSNITPGSGFELRRFNFGAEAKIAGNWSVFGVLECDAGNNGTNSNGGTAATQVGPNGQNGVQLTNGARYDIIIDKAGVSYDTQGEGTITAAVQKTHFGFEDYTSAYDIYSIERSPESFYFGYYYDTGANGTKTALTGNTTIGGRKVGLYFDKQADKKEGGFLYGAGVSNAYDDSYTSQTNSTDENYLPEFYANVGYVWKINKDSSLETGLNGAYTGANTGQITDNTTAATLNPAAGGNPAYYSGGNGSSIANHGMLSGTTSTNADFDSQTYGLEWLTKYKNGNLTLIADVLAAYVVNGRYDSDPGQIGHADNALPLGVTFTAAYKVTPEIEPVLMVGYLESDGRGIQEGGVVRDYNNTNSSTAYDRCFNVFAGVNWYITPKTVKLSAGFEGTQFEGLAHGQTDVNGTRAQDYGFRVQLSARL